MAEYRDKHCSFAVINNRGKCNAFCHWNQRTRWLIDCTGREGKTIDTYAGREIPMGKGLHLSNFNNQREDG